MRVKIYGLRFVNSYQDGMALSQCEHFFGSEEERNQFLKEENWTESIDWTDEQGCEEGYEGWQGFEQELDIKIF